MNTITVACAIIIIEKKVLIVQRSEQMKLPLKWEFPGGKVERNESEIECVIREVQEELRINIIILEQLDKFTTTSLGKKFLFVPFIAKYLSGKIELVEHKGYCLINLDEVYNYDFAEADHIMLNQENIASINKYIS